MQLPVPEKYAVVIIPPVQDFYITPHRTSALGVEIVVTILGNHGYQVSTLDCMEATTTGTQLPIPSALDHLKPHLLPDETGRCSFFTRFRHFGYSYDTAIGKLEPMHPSLIFLSCFAFCYSTPALELAVRIKERYPRTAIIAGGAGVSVFPEYFLRHPSIDYTLSGEAEVSLPPLLRHFDGHSKNPEHIPHFGWKEETTLRFSSLTAFTDNNSLMPVIRKTTEGRGSIRYTASVSRGCPARCGFCSNHLTHGRPFRRSRTQHFQNLLERLPESPAGTEVQFNFEDDNLLFDAPFFRDLIERCRKRFPNCGFYAENGLDYRLLTPQQCTELIAAGFRQFNFTIGSVTPEVLTGEHRGFAAETYHRLLELAADSGIPVVSYLICGLPGDTKRTIADNLLFLIRQRSLVGMSLFYPVPGQDGELAEMVLGSLN